MDGLIVVDKPSGWTSHDVVLKIRSCLVERRVGHFGTLDPLATGLLLVAVGRATRFFPFYSKSEKSYKGRMRLGLATDTYDALGRPEGPECLRLPGWEALRTGMAAFLGAIRQIPPAFSAKKINGRPSYELARSRKAVPLKAEEVTIHAFSLLDFSPPYADFEASCSSGTYIRSLVHDLGVLLGCGAYLEGLCRTASGEHRLEEAFRIEEIERLAALGEKERFLLPLESLLPGFPALKLSESGFRTALNGNAVSPDDVEGLPPEPSPGCYRLFSPEGRLSAVARLEPGAVRFHPFLVLS